jgi:hypothetical protein
MVGRVAHRNIAIYQTRIVGHIAAEKMFEATSQRQFNSPLRCKSANFMSGDLAGAIAVQLGAIL